MNIVRKVFSKLAKNLSIDDHLNESATENGLVRATPGKGSAIISQHGSDSEEGSFKAPKFLLIIFHVLPFRYI